MSQKERYISCKWCKRLILLIDLARIYFHFLLELRFWKLKVHAYTSVALLACREGRVRTSDFIWARVIKEVSEPTIRKFNNNIGRFAFECEMEYWQTGVIFVEWIEFVIYISLDDLQDKTNLEFHIFQEIRLNSLTRHFVCLNRFFKVLCSTVLHCFLFLLIPDNIRFLFIIITFCCVLTWDENRSSLLLFRRLFHLPVLNNSFFPFYSDLLFRPRE